MKGKREMRGNGKRKRGEKEKKFKAHFLQERGDGTRAFAVPLRQGDFEFDTPLEQFRSHGDLNILALR